MQIYINEYIYIYLSKKKKIANGYQVSMFDKCMWFYIIKIQNFGYKLYITCKDSHGISSAQYFFWIGSKNSFLWGFLDEGTRAEDNGNWGFQDHTKWFFFFLLQTPESSLGYKYWISYLKLTPLLEGQV